MKYLFYSSFYTVENLIWYISFLVLLLCIIGLIIFIFVGKHYQTKHMVNIKKMSNFQRIYIINVKQDRVTYFNRNNLKKKTNSSIIDFYNRFPAKNRSLLINWIGSLIDSKKESNHYLEIDVEVGKNKVRYTTLLQVHKIDVDKQLIYIESYLLKAIQTNNISSSFLNEESFKNLLDVKRNYKNISIAFSFYDKKRGSNIEVPRILFSNIKESFLTYLSNHRFAYLVNDNTIIFTDLKHYSSGREMNIITTLRNQINKIISLNSLSHSIECSIGVIDNSIFNGDSEKIIKSVLFASSLSKDDNNKITWFEKHMDASCDFNDTTFRTEVEKIIKEKKLSYKFRLIYDSSRGRTIGYKSIITPVDTFFDSLAELKNYAIRTEDDSKLFATISKNVISRYMSGKTNNSSKLFYNIKYSELTYAVKYLSQAIKDNSLRMVLIIDESDLIFSSHGKDNSLTNELLTLKARGFDICLLIEDYELRMPSYIYKVFDYYIIGQHLSIDSKTDSRKRVQLHGVIEKLLPFNKTIIADDVSNWREVELLINLGINLISSDVISMSDELLLPISTKNATKVKNMNL